VQASRVIAVAALLVAATAAFLLLRGADKYTVTARMESATQIVKGNLVQVAGEPVGKVTDIRVTDDSRAELRLEINEDYAPLRTGTRAVVRQLSLSGQANRYIDLQLGGARGSEIEDGGTIPAKDVVSAVELDQLFQVFDSKTRPGIKRTIKLFGQFSGGRTDEANAALQYFNPALAASTRLFDELTADRTQLERFIVQTGRLTNDLAARDDDLAGSIDNLGRTMEALSTEKDDLGESIERLPQFLRRTNTTFVNLRSTLDDLDPLVESAGPVVGEDLPALFAQLRPFARDAAPTLRDLSTTIRATGADNDLVDLLRRQPAVDRIANRTAQRNGKERAGAFPALRKAVDGAAPQLGFMRNYTPELIGWFDDFSTSGMYDALGSFSRAGLEFNAFTFDPTAGVLPIPPELRREAFAQNLVTGRNNRCPGSQERPAADGSNPFRPSDDFPCDPKQVPVGR
jgi:phospholipid/cholesterol/gamma-HCH transport system substrate-binding protein